MAHFQKLKVWEKAHALMVQTHGVVKRMKRTYDKSLCAQMNRAAESIAANIVEGKGKSSDAEFARFLRFALGSAHELEYHFIAARDIEAIPADAAAPLIAQVIEVRRMIYGLLKRLEGGK
ncbi:MAG TPA: four helix bundle protein [Gemmatimonadaceae bacterium]|jgi:four helix bundle protein|nr:four helix bundle protein [Gemmatimonadaceae bacterium]